MCRWCKLGSRASGDASAVVGAQDTRNRLAQLVFSRVSKVPIIESNVIWFSSTVDVQVAVRSVVTAGLVVCESRPHQDWPSVVTQLLCAETRFSCGRVTSMMKRGSPRSVKPAGGQTQFACPPCLSGPKSSSPGSCSCQSSERCLGRPQPR